MSEKVRHRSNWRTPDQDWRELLRRLQTSFSQYAECKALISKYIVTIPISIGPLPRTAVSSAMIAKVGVAARLSHSAASRVAPLPLPARKLSS
jgi:hypothetical protein